MALKFDYPDPSQVAMKTFPETQFIARDTTACKIRAVQFCKLLFRSHTENNVMLKQKLGAEKTAGGERNLGISVEQMRHNSQERTYRYAIYIFMRSWRPWTVPKF